MVSFVVIFSILSIRSINAHITEDDVTNWDESEVTNWLSESKISEIGIEYILNEGVRDGEELLFLRDEEVRKETLTKGLKMKDKVRFKNSFDQLIELITNDEQQQSNDSNRVSIEYVMVKLKESCNINVNINPICQCINNNNNNIDNNIEKLRQPPKLIQMEYNNINNNQANHNGRPNENKNEHYEQQNKNKNENESENENELNENEKEPNENESNENESNESESKENENAQERERAREKERELFFSYSVRDVISDSNELKREIIFTLNDNDILSSGSTGTLLYLHWCVVNSDDSGDDDIDYCCKQSFSFSKQTVIGTTILTNIEYDFKIFDQNEQYKPYQLMGFMDEQPNKAFYFSGIIINSTLNNKLLNDKLKTAKGAQFDMLIEIQLAKEININSKRIDCDSNENKNYLSKLELFCVLNIVPNSIDLNDKLMAEKIRSILLQKYGANKVDISQKIDANSYGDINNNINGKGSIYNWLSVNNSTVFIFCFIVLCGGIIVGFQKKFPFKYQNVYSKLSSFNKTNNIIITNNNNNDNKSEEKDLNINTLTLATTEKNAAQEFLEKVFKNLGTPSFITSKYIQNLKDDYISSIDQLREFDDEDWKRYGFKKNHIILIKNKLQNDSEDDDDDADDVSFDDDEDDGWNNKQINNNNNNNKQTDNNDSTSGFDDF